MRNRKLAINQAEVHPSIRYLLYETEIPKDTIRGTDILTFFSFGCDGYILVGADRTQSFIKMIQAQ